MRVFSCAAVAALTATAGCIEPIAEHRSPIGEVVTDCVVPSPAGLGAPVSLEYPDASLWIWDEVTLAGGAVVPAAFARVTSVAGVCAHGVELVTGAGGAPASLLALSADELADNASRTDGTRLALVPTGGVVVEGTGYLYYDHVRRGPGFLDAERLGTGLCVLPPGAAACERERGGAGQTILWAPGERVLDRGGIVVDGDLDDATPRVVIAGCRKVASFEFPCTIAGALVAALRDPAAYQVFEVFRGWVDALTDASVFADAPGELTLSAYDGGYLATALDIFENRVVVQRSRRAVTGYGHRIAAFDVVPPDEAWFVSGGREHAALRPEARSIVVTYATDGAAAPGLHVVAFRFHGDFQ